MKDVAKISIGLSEIYPSLKLNITDLDESFMAARTIQKIRHSLWNYIRGTGTGIEYNFQSMYESIKKCIEPIFANSRTFKVKRIHSVEITNDTEPFKIMERTQYEELCRLTTIHK